MSQRRAPRGLLAALLLSAAIASVVAGCGHSAGGADSDQVPELEVVDADATSGYDYDYVIPDGTGHRLDLGEEVEIVPAELDVEVGERIRIVNEDERGAAVGIFWVPAGRTVALEFTAPGTLSGECDIHPDGSFTINVQEA